MFTEAAVLLQVETNCSPGLYLAVFLPSTLKELNICNYFVEIFISLLKEFIYICIVQNVRFVDHD